MLNIYVLINDLKHARYHNKKHLHVENGAISAAVLNEVAFTYTNKNIHLSLL
jgi:hypothetical protein